MKKFFVKILVLLTLVITASSNVFAQSAADCAAKGGQFAIGQTCSGSDLPELGCSPGGQQGVYIVRRCEAGCVRQYPESNPNNLPANCSRPPVGGNTGQTMVEQVFGFIVPPIEIINYGFGSKGISQFLNMFINLLFMIASIAFVFMIIWGAVELLISGGNKEQVASGKNRIMFAIIGIILMAVAFAIIRVIGTFTGFTFFG